MTKGIIIIGEENTGKSLTARILASAYKQDEIIIIDGNEFRKNSNLAFQGCQINTDVIIIDELKATDTLEPFISVIHEGIIVEKQSQAPFKIIPEIIIIVCCTELKKEQIIDMDSSISRRFEIIECTKDTLEKQLQSLK